MALGASLRLLGNTCLGAAAVSFVVPWAAARYFPSTAGLAGAPQEQVLVSGSQAGIPPRVLTAIVAASKVECHIPWYVLGGISKVESEHADNGHLDANGNTIGTINGPYISWLDTEAVGPFQFIPSSWELFGNGGNPNNIDDAAMAAARHLCASGKGRTDEAGLREAIYGYNHSQEYVDKVMYWARTYSVLTPQAATPKTRSALGDVAAFWSSKADKWSQGSFPRTAIVPAALGSFWGWVGNGESKPAQWAAPPPKGSPDPQCPGRHFTQDGRFHAPPGTTTPEMTAQVARALRAKFGTDASMLRAVADRSASDGAAYCSDHLWGGGLDTSGVVYGYVKQWEGVLFRFVTNEYLDGHAHISMAESVDPRVLQRFLDETCAGADCAAQANWDPPAQYSFNGDTSLNVLST